MTAIEPKGLYWDMRFNLDTLQALTQSADYYALPTRFAREAVPDDNWWQTLEALTDEGARIKLWEIGQCAALLFDTYGDLIDEVSLDVGHYALSNEPYWSLTPPAAPLLQTEVAT